MVRLFIGAKEPATDLVSGETKVVGGGTPAADDASFTGAKVAAGTIDLATTGIEWGKGIQGQGLPWEDYLGTQLSAGSRLPPNFKTFDFFDETTGVATSAKTLDTAAAYAEGVVVNSSRTRF